MGFFDDASLEPDTAREAGVWERPAGELPRAAESALLLAQTDMVAVAVSAIWAFSSGFEFWTGALFRQPGPALQTEPDDQSLHIGLRFADGRKVANVGRVPGPAGSVPGNLLLTPLSFGRRDASPEPELLGVATAAGRAHDLRLRVDRVRYPGNKH